MIKKFPTLYKAGNIPGKINQWQIIVEDNKFYTISGYVGMKLFQNEPTVCTPKNIGKSNNTTAEEQALFEANAMFNKRKEMGYWEDIDQCDIPKFFEPMLAKDYNKEKKKVVFPVLSQPKLDGVRCIIKEDGMWTRTGKPIISAPHIFEELKHIFQQYPGLILDGELYTSNKEVDFNMIISCVKKTKPKQEDLNISKQYIEYWCYDCIDTLENPNSLFIDRIRYLLDIVDTYDKFSYLKIVDSYIFHNHKDIEDQLKIYLEEGFEGQIIRMNKPYQNKRSSFLLKHKNFFDEEFKIIKINEGIGKYANKAATVTVDVDGVHVDCTINGTMDYLEEVLNNKDYYIGKQATIKYFEKTPDGSLRFPKAVNLDRCDNI